MIPVIERTGGDDVTDVSPLFLQMSDTQVANFLNNCSGVPDLGESNFFSDGSGAPDLGATPMQKSPMKA